MLILVFDRRRDFAVDYLLEDGFVGHDRDRFPTLLRGQESDAGSGLAGRAGKSRAGRSDHQQRDE
jgi:hypothetical protein